MSKEIYFDILPQDLIPKILINLPYDIGLYSLIEILTKKEVYPKSRIYRNLCITIHKELKLYPEKITLKGLQISWENVYEAVISHSEKELCFDIYDFYLNGIYNNNNGIIISLLLWHYVNYHTEEIILFTGTLFKRQILNLSVYHKRYFRELIDESVNKRNNIIKEKIKTLKNFGSGNTVIDTDNIIYSHIYLDMECNKIQLEASYFGDEDIPDVILLYKDENQRPELYDVYKKGYDGTHKLS